MDYSPMVRKGELAVFENTVHIYALKIHKIISNYNIKNFVLLPVEGLIADTAKYSPSPLQLMLQVSSCD